MMVYLIYIQLPSIFMATAIELYHLYYFFMNYLICKKHNKIEKTGDKAVTNAFICLNKNCNEHFKVICSICKADHRDHINYILNLQSLHHHLQQAMAQEQIAASITETLSIMKKLKLIKEFRNKIEILEKQIQEQSLQLIAINQSLLQQYRLSAQSLQDWSQIINNLKIHDSFKQFSSKSAVVLQNIEFSVKKGKLQHQSQSIVAKEHRHKKVVQLATNKIGEVQDYSMKIIEVIIHSQDSDDQGSASYKRKHYQVLKENLLSEDRHGEAQGVLKRSRVTTCNSSTDNSRVKKDWPLKETHNQGKILAEKQSRVEREQKHMVQSRNKH